jgi:hypothetical protein
MSIIKTRRHAIYSARECQLRLNRLASEGGKPYVLARLWRAPNETDVSWNGDSKRGIVGRLERTAIVSDAARVVNKINQYLFRVETPRNGIDESFRNNCTGSGQSIHAFMADVCDAITWGRWCWLQVDRMPLRVDENGDVIPESLANKQGVTWSLWDALSVTDWYIDDNGIIRWIIVRSSVYQNSDPREPSKDGALYTLYELVDGKVYVTEEADGITIPNLRVREEIHGLNQIPFVCVGKPANGSWWFDDVENIQAQILNLDSAHNETLTERVYPQIIIPSSAMNSLEVMLKESNINGERVASLVRELTIGRNTPLCEAPEDKGICRYITPQGDLKMLVEESDRKRKLLFDFAGLAMFNRETRQVQTAESKAFDQLDTNATLGNRALILKDAEKKMVTLSKVFDPSFKEWEANYSTDYDVVDIPGLSSALVNASNMPDITPKMKKIIAKANVKILKEVAAGVASEEDFEEALREIEETEFDVHPVLPNPFEDMEEDPEDGE